MGRRLLLLTGFLCGFLVAGRAQDPVFSQFYAAPLQLNPAFAGVSTSPRISANYRHQWPNWPNAYRTYAVSFEQPLTAFNSGFGIMALADDAGNGIYRTYGFHGVYSYHLQFSDDYVIKFGVEGGILQTRVDWDKLLFGDQIDPISGPVDPGGNPGNTEELRPSNLDIQAVDFGTGLLLHSSQGYLGLSLRHINRPNESLLNIKENLRVGRPLRFSVHAGWEFDFAGGNNLRYPSFISPNILVIRQGDFSQINAGAYLGSDLLFGGLWYRYSGGTDAAIALFGLRYGVLRMGYSYDLTLSRLGALRTGGTHEISFAVNFEDSSSARRRRKASDLNNCFKMFN